MKFHPFRLLTPALILLASALMAAPHEMPEATKTISEPVRTRRGPLSPSRFLAPQAQVRLGAPDLAAVQAEDSQARSAAPVSKGPTRVGIRRPLGQSVQLVGAKTPWMIVENGERVWSMRIGSDGAHAIRVRFEDVRLPEGAEIVVYDTADPTRFEGPFDAAYLSGRETFWSSSVFAADVTVECRVPALAAAPAFRITEVTHRYVAFGNEGRAADEAKAAAACNIDVSCEPAWAETSHAVAGIGSVSASGELFCTGCLLNDASTATNTDFFLTANHCITGQTDADTTEFYWNYQTASCNATPPSPATVPRTRGGATILSSRSLDSANDHCFMRLRGLVPAGVTYAGWSVDAPSATEVITGIHHPDGDYKRISFGTARALDANYWRILWNRGVTEPGSSGSPIFNASHQLIGQLYGGESSCTNANPALQVDQYGRFDITFPLVRRWLLNEAVNPPANDDFANAQALSGAEGTATALTQDASRETGEPNHANGGGRNSVWYQWTATASTNVTFETVGSGFDTVLAVYTGSSLANLKAVAFNNDAEPGTTASRVGFAAVSGRTYFIAADGFDGENGTLRLAWHPGGELTLPPNDRFADATTVVGFGGIYHSDNRGFTREAGEPDHAGTRGSRSAWWIWTAPISGPVNINTFGSTFDTLLAVYTGTTVSGLVQIASNDDFNAAGQIFESAVNFNAVAGRTYRIAVDGFANATSQEEGEIRLEVAQGGGTPGANNAFSAAVPITGAAGQATGNNVNFTHETGEPDHGGIVGRRSAWWSWTAPSTGNFIFETVGSAFDTVLAVYTGNAVNALTEVVSNDDIVIGDVWQSRVTFPAVAGTVYRIAVDGYFEAGGTQEEGNIRLAWRVSNAVVLQGDLAVNPAVLNPRVEARTFSPADCEVAAGCATVGSRRLLLFDLEVRNIGLGSVGLGVPSAADGFVTNACRGGLEYPGFVAIRLLSTNGTQLASRSASLCVSDGVRWNTATGPSSAQFTCENQGISVGWAATSPAGAACRWLDVTGVPDGPYLLEVEVDPSGRITESNETNNAVRVPVQLAAPIVVPNDAFAAATVVTGPSGTAGGSTVGATTEAGEPASSSRATVWYSWTAPCSGTAVFDTLGSAFDTLLDAYSGATLTTLNLLAEGDDIGDIVQSEVRFTAVGGQVYHLRVDGFDTAATGAVTLHWRLENPTGCGGAPRPQLAGGWVASGAFEVRFTSQAGVTYALQSTEDLSRTPVQWTQLGTLAGNGGPQALQDSTASQASSRARYYRVVTVP
jgi:hypothetical protein